MNDTKTTFGAYFKALRKERRVTLRAFCETAGADPGNISRMERGGMVPPRTGTSSQGMRKRSVWWRAALNGISSSIWPRLVAA